MITGIQEILEGLAFDGQAFTKEEISFALG